MEILYTYKTLFFSSGLLLEPITLVAINQNVYSSVCDRASHSLSFIVGARRINCLVPVSGMNYMSLGT